MAKKRSCSGACYTKSLQLAVGHGCTSVAFPLLAAGNNSFPKDLALQIAINVFSRFLMQHDMQIYLVLFHRDVFVLSEKLFHAVQSFIDDTYTKGGIRHWHLDTPLLYQFTLPKSRRIRTCPSPFTQKRLAVLLITLRIHYLIAFSIMHW
ncbi:MAG: macro domain-containing protein [Peptococcaceae bacterium]